MCSHPHRPPSTPIPKALRTKPPSSHPLPSAVPSCDVVVLGGTTPASPSARPPGGGIWVNSAPKDARAGACMGRYERKALLSFAQKPVFAMTKAPASCGSRPGRPIFLFYAASIKMWVASAQLGLAPYLLAVRSDAATPEDVAGVWTVADTSGTFRPVPTIHAACGPKAPPTHAMCMLIKTSAPRLIRRKFTI